MYWLVPEVHPSHYLSFFDPTCWQWLTWAHSMFYFFCVLSTLRYLFLLALPFVSILPPAWVSCFLSSVVISYWNEGLPFCIEMESLFGLKKSHVVNAKWMSWNRILKTKSSWSKENTQYFLHFIILEGYDTFPPETVTHYCSNLGGGMPKKICCLKIISQLILICPSVEIAPVPYWKFMTQRLQMSSHHPRVTTTIQKNRGIV